MELPIDKWLVDQAKGNIRQDMNQLTSQLMEVDQVELTSKFESNPADG
jgi:hypothetical protein